MTEDNHLVSAKPVCQAIVERTERELGEAIPHEVTNVGKEFRKYVGNRLIGQTGTVRQLKDKASVDAEKAATKFFDEKIGLKYYVWPQAQRNPDGPSNRVVLNVDNIHIVRIDKIELTPDDFQLVQGSEKEIPLGSL